MPRFERTQRRLLKSQIEYWECEIDGATVHQSSGIGDGSAPPQAAAASPSSFTYRTEARARRAVRGYLRWHLEQGYVEVGPSLVLSRHPATSSFGPFSFLLLDTDFAASDDRFLLELFKCANADKLGAYAEKWLTDPRPWARRMLIAYIDDGCDRPCHKPLVKRLFKGAEANGDDELMVHFMVAFDRLVNRVVEKQRAKTRIERDPFVLRSLDHANKSSKRFSLLTRQYLGRRAYRYFRKLGHRDVGRYGAAIRAALPLYRDSDLATPLRLFDAWGLMSAIYGRSSVLMFSPRGIRLRLGHSIAELAPAPPFAEAFDGVFGELVPMLLVAASRVARRFIIDTLQSRYRAELERLDWPTLSQLGESQHDEVQALFVDVLKGAAAAKRFSVEEWLDVLESHRLNENIVALLAELVATRVTAEMKRGKLASLERGVKLSMSPIGPIADLGVTIIEAQGVHSEQDLALVFTLRAAPTQRARMAGSELVKSAILRGLGTVEHVRDLLDALHAEPRALALSLLEQKTELCENEKIFYALTESPWSEVREAGLREAARWMKETDAQRTDALKRLWAVLILSVHNGSRAKTRALRQVADALARDERRAQELVPLLVVALRSVRGSERMSALANLTRAAAQKNTLRVAIETAIPELRIGQVVTQ